MEACPTFIYALLEPDLVTVRYVGKTVDLRTRYNSHLHPNVNKQHTHKARWISSLLRRGQKPVMVELECVAPGGDWEARERYWIAYYRDAGFPLTNHSEGGEGACGAVRSAETRMKISEAHRGKVVSEETRRKISEANRGRRYSAEDRKQMSESRRGRKRSPEARERIAEVNRRRGRPVRCTFQGKHHTEETKALLREQKLGTTMSDESREKMSRAQTGRKHAPETIEKQREARRRYWQRRREEKAQQSSSDAS